MNNMQLSTPHDPLIAATGRTAAVGERVGLGRYTVPQGDRVLIGQRVDGVVRISDCPADGCDRAYLIERGLEQDGNGALQALVADYLDQATRLNEIPMRTSLLQRYLDALGRD